MLTYMPNVGAPNLFKHTLIDLKTQKDPNAVMVEGFNTPLSPLDRSSRQKFNKETLELNDTIDQVDLTNFYRVFHPTQHNIHSSQQPMELSSKYFRSQSKS
jgi:hypothetical protein